MKSLLDRFEDKYCPEPNTGCWLWCANRDRGGYGRFWVERKTPKRAHRISWELYRGEIIEGLQVLHRCDTPLCVNPYHLFLGTNIDNIIDKTKKGRARNGNMSKEFCKRGHPLVEGNLYRPSTRKNSRHCRQCSLDWSNARYARQKSKVIGEQHAFE